MPLAKNDKRASGVVLEDLAMNDNILIDMGFAKEKIESLSKSGSRFFTLRKSKDNGQCLFLAATNGDHVELKKLLKAPTIEDDLKYISPKSLNSPLHKAARYGHIKCVKLLVQSSAAINPFNKNGETPLHNAVENNHIAIVMHLLQHGGNPNYICTSSGLSPFHIAVMKGYFRCFSIILETDVNSLEREIDYEPLDLNNRTIKGETALHLCSYDRGAFRKNNLLMAEKMLELGVTIKLQDNAGNTALHAAAACGAVSICQLLVDAQANVNTTNSLGKAPVDVALSKLTDELLFAELEHNLMQKQLEAILTATTTTTTSKPIARFREKSKTHLEVRPRKISVSEVTNSILDAEFSVSLAGEIVLCVTIHISNPPPLGGNRDYVYMTMDNSWTIQKVVSFITQYLGIKGKRKFSIYKPDYINSNHTPTDITKKLVDFYFEAKADIIFHQNGLPFRAVSTPNSKSMGNSVKDRRSKFFTSKSLKNVRAHLSVPSIPAPKDDSNPSISLRRSDSEMSIKRPKSTKLSPLSPTRKLRKERPKSSKLSPQMIRATHSRQHSAGGWERAKVNKARESTMFLTVKAKNLTKESKKEMVGLSKREIMLQNEVTRTRNRIAMVGGDCDGLIEMPLNKDGVTPPVDVWFPSSLKELATMKKNEETLFISDKIKRREQTEVRKQRLAALLHFYQISLPAEIPLSLSLHVFHSFVLFGDKLLNETIESFE